ncbi:MAG TPA: cation:proton antiporter [Candidatus Pacearchaeota archaeon]|nr:glutathione-regulated potassium-efflux system protein KefC [archaeon BMS3Abin17]HDK42185.1 cation:proton antiporter [Candidatus Pacearchaeota archaeon]HDZ60232.1 cation:proton antiporter [Candidatus Pacearchaeota archaeon]
MINIFLFLGLVFLLTFLIGRLLEKIRVPWIFSALIIGSLFAIYNPFTSITSSSTFEFLAQLGMYFLLFLIGFEIDLKKLKKSKNFIFKATFFTLFLATIFGTLLIHFVFGYSWLISSLVALSFATVGEAILIPILDEFKIVNTKLGQSIIGIGTLDDVIEILLLILVGVVIGSGIHSGSNIILTLISLAVLVILAFSLIKLKKQDGKLKFISIEYLFLFILFVLFLFLGIGKLAHAAPIAALLAGITLNAFLPDNRVEGVKTGIKILCYGFFAPIFFLWVGISLDINYLFASPLLILLVVAVSNGAKLLGSWMIGRKELGTKQSILLGIGLSVRFSTSIIIIKILLDNNLIEKDLYSVIIASAIILTFLVPVLFSRLLVRWKVTR